MIRNNVKVFKTKPAFESSIFKTDKKVKIIDIQPNKLDNNKFLKLKNKLFV